jgi:hypothetical protein
LMRMGADEVRAAALTGRSPSLALSTELFPAGVTPRETIF